VVDANDKQLGLKSLYEALRLAEEQDLDLVEVGPGSRPPVARVMDYGKYCYEQEKKSKQQGKSATEIKEVRLSVNIDEHDWNVKLNNAKKFMAESGRVRVGLQLMGRQMLFQDRAMDRLYQFRDQLNGEFDDRPQRMGRRYYVIIKKKKDNAKT